MPERERPEFTPFAGGREERAEGWEEEQASDELLDTTVLARVIREGDEAEAERERKIARRGE